MRVTRPNETYQLTNGSEINLGSSRQADLDEVALTFGFAPQMLRLHSTRRAAFPQVPVSRAIPQAAFTTSRGVCCGIAPDTDLKLQGTDLVAQPNSVSVTVDPA
jgi:hypothetical protein